MCIRDRSGDRAVMTYCDPSDDTQLWSLTVNNVLVNKLNNLCLTREDWFDLTLGRCNGDENQLWNYDGLTFSQDGAELDGNSSDGNLITWAIEAGALHHQWVIPSEALVKINNGSGEAITYPISIEDKDKFEIEIIKDIINRSTSLSESLPVARDISAFPGNVGESEGKVSQTITLDRNFYEPAHPGWQKRKHWQSTGLYAKAGDIITINVKSEDVEAIKDLSVIINVHSDKLSLGKYNASTQLLRFPNVHLNKPLTAGINEVRSQYGGLIVIDSGDVTVDAMFDIEISNAVQAPYYKLGETTEQQWQAMKALDVPWGVFESDSVTVNMSKTDILKIEDPAALMTFYEQGRHDVHETSGFEADATTGPHRAPTLRSRIVDDIQISVGFAHAGYPIMASPGWDSYNINNQADGSWGTWHEIGHNYQQKCFWMVYGVEVTTNIPPLFIQEKNDITSRLIKEKRYTNAINALNRKGGSYSDFSEVTDAFIGLIFLAQISDAFEGEGDNQGLNIFRQLNRKYREFDAETQQAICDSDQKSFDTSYELLSEITGHDLTEHFTTWGVPLSEESLTRVTEMNLPQPAVNISFINKEI